MAGASVDRLVLSWTVVGDAKPPEAPLRAALPGQVGTMSGVERRLEDAARAHGEVVAKLGGPRSRIASLSVEGAQGSRALQVQTIIEEATREAERLFDGWPIDVSLSEIAVDVAVDPGDPLAVSRVARQIAAQVRAALPATSPR